MSDFESLALLYLQHQDLSGITPEQLLDMYQDTLDRINAKKKSNDAEARAKKREINGEYIPLHMR